MSIPVRSKKKKNRILLRSSALSGSFLIFFFTIFEIVKFYCIVVRIFLHFIYFYCYHESFHLRSSFSFNYGELPVVISSNISLLPHSSFLFFKIKKLFIYSLFILLFIYMTERVKEREHTNRRWGSNRQRERDK